MSCAQEPWALTMDAQLAGSIDDLEPSVRDRVERLLGTRLVGCEFRMWRRMPNYPYPAHTPLAQFYLTATGADTGRGVR